MSDSKRLFLYITLSVLIASCTVKKKIPVVLPPSFTFTKDVKKIVVVNNSGKKGLDIESVLTLEGKNSDAIAAGHCVQTLQKTINESGLFEVVIDSSVILVNSEGLVNWDTINAICKKNGAQALVSLNYFDSDVSILDVNIPSVLSVNKSVSSMALFSIYQPQSVWRKENIKVVDGRSKSSSYLFSLPIYMSEKIDFINNIGEYMGKEAARDFFPTPVYLSRIYYLMEGSKAIRKRDWDLAETTYEELIKTGPKIKKRRAMFNLALVKEAKGDLYKALELAILVSKYPVKPPYDYVAHLKARIFLEKDELNYPPVK